MHALYKPHHLVLYCMKKKNPDNHTTLKQYEFTFLGVNYSFETLTLISIYLI